MKQTLYDKDLIVKTIEKRGLTAYSIAQDLPLTEYGIGKIISGESKNPRQSTLQILHNYLFKNQDVGQMEVAQPHEVFFVENKNGNGFTSLENGQFLMMMPLAEYKIQAGLLDHYQDMEYMESLSKHSIIVDEPYKGRYLAFRVKGDSMDDGTSQAIVEGSIVSTRELQKHLWKDKIRFKDFPYWVIYTTQSRYPLLKEIVKHDTQKGIIKCHSLNDGPEYSDFDLSLDDVQALFYVVDINRQVSKKATY